MVCWLPWLPLHETVTLGRIMFRPFRANSPLDGCDTKLSGQLSSLAGRFIDIHGQPVQKLAIAICDADMTFPVLEDDAIEAVLKAARLLMLAYHGGNMYFSRTGARYVNSSVFQVVVQKFVAGDEFTTVVTRRREGLSKDGGYERSEIREQSPRSVHSCHEGSCDKTFLDALSVVVDGKREHHRRIANSLAWFALANTDSFAMPESNELVLLLWSIDHLLNTEGTNRAYQESIGEKLGKYASAKADSSRRPLGEMPRKDEDTKVPPNECLILKQWAFQHYLLRNNITHGNDWLSKEWRWNVREHCVFAAWLYPLLVKVILSEQDEYQFTYQDKGALAAIDTILASDDWQRDWQKAIEYQKKRLCIEQGTQQVLERHPELGTKLREALGE